MVHSENGYLLLCRTLLLPEQQIPGEERGVTFSPDKKRNWFFEVSSIVLVSLSSKALCNTVKINYIFFYRKV